MLGLLMGRGWWMSESRTRSIKLKRELCGFDWEVPLKFETGGPARVDADAVHTARPVAARHPLYGCAMLE